MKRSTLRSLLALSVLAVMPAAAFAAGELREGVDYARVSPPVPQSGPGVEVIEFFAYGCPHCNQAEPAVSKWRASLPKDVTFRRVPISFANPKWEPLTRLYLTLETTGDLARLHTEVFAAVHQQKLPLATERDVIEWASKRVADPKKFTDTYRSFGIQAASRNAEQTGLKFGISAVPSFGVGGRYLVLAKEAKTFPEVLRVADRVIEMARQTQK